MKKVRWLASKNSYVRVLRPQDFSRLGTLVTEDVTFSKENDFTVLMEDHACDTLVAKLPGEFVALEAPEDGEVEVQPDGSGLAPDAAASLNSGQAEPEGSSSESEVDETRAVDESPSPRVRKS